jgi:hypothetical protein
MLHAEYLRELSETICGVLPHALADMIIAFNEPKTRSDYLHKLKEDNGGSLPLCLEFAELPKTRPFDWHILFSGTFSHLVNVMSWDMFDCYLCGRLVGDIEPYHDGYNEVNYFMDLSGAHCVCRTCASTVIMPELNRRRACLVKRSLGDVRAFECAVRTRRQRRALNPRRRILHYAALRL